VTTPRRNWAGDRVIAGERLHEPRSLGELRELVARLPHVRAVGSGHTFNDLPDSRGDLVSLEAMPRHLEVDPQGTVTIGGAMRYAAVCEPLDRAGFALEAMASLAHISVAGACATGTHGSGDRTRSLAAAVTAMDVVTATGDLVTIDRSTPAGELAGVVVSLGALGIVTGITLETVPRYEVRQDVYEDVLLDSVVDQLDVVTALADSVSLFTTWRDRRFHQVWCKARSDQEYDPARVAEVLRGRRAIVPHHPIPGHDPVACTTQLGVIGPWHERLPHFRSDQVPSSGAELQSEYLIDRRDGARALRALFDASAGFASVCQVSEVRTVESDDLWLSPAFGRPSLALHFTWQLDHARVAEALPVVEAALAPYGPRPHWGKMWTMPVGRVRAGQPRLADFVALRERWDPGRKFANRYIDALLGE
jgi:xylitol oxidase